MIYIICGELNQGKTAKIKSIYEENMHGDGFVTEKIITDSIFCGYKVKRITTGDSEILLLRTEFFPLDETPFFTKGSFSFYEKGFIFASSIIDDIIINDTGPVFIDEIGAIELAGKGLHDSFRKILHTDKTIYITVRNCFVKDVISFFSLKKFTLIRI
ncbi:MAG TPA: nucleoside-triphosphatase [Spirochaetota bacterium]|nr:nucleoside-triphosphatase [Spirochaetota bacterium]